MARPGAAAAAAIGKIPPPHLAGMVILIFAVALHTFCMWSSPWSRWEGCTENDDGGSTYCYKGANEDHDTDEYEKNRYSHDRNEVHDNGPWMRDCWRRGNPAVEEQHWEDNCDIEYLKDKSDRQNCYTHNSGTEYNDDYYHVWEFGTRRRKDQCILRGSNYNNNPYGYFTVSVEHCKHTRGEITEEWNKCNRLQAVRVCTMAAMILGFFALFLSTLAIVVPQTGKYACLGCCLVALLAGFFIFVGVCIWADIYRWEKKIMVEQCRAYWHNNDFPNDSHDDLKCWGTTGRTSYDDEDWEDASPPYSLAWAWGLEIPTMLFIPAGGMLVAYVGYKP